MATVDGTARTAASDAASLVLDREIEASLRGETSYPNGTVFVPEDLAGEAVVGAYRAAGSPVAVVRENGSVDFLPASSLKTERIVLGLLVAGVVYWLLSRGRGRIAA